MCQLFRNNMRGELGDLMMDECAPKREILSENLWKMQMQTERKISAQLVYELWSGNINDIGWIELRKMK